MEEFPLRKFYRVASVPQHFWPAILTLVAALVGSAWVHDNQWLYYWCGVAAIVGMEAFSGVKAARAFWNLSGHVVRIDENGIEVKSGRVSWRNVSKVEFQLGPISESPWAVISAADGSTVTIPGAIAERKRIASIILARTPHFARITDYRGNVVARTAT